MVYGRNPVEPELGSELLGGDAGGKELVRDGAAIPPGPLSDHQRVAAVLMAELNRHFDAELGTMGGWWVHYRPRVRLGGEVQVPDLAAWRQERLPRQPAPADLVSAPVPDWVCEVLLPHTVLTDRNEKMAGYEHAGVSRVWLIDPMSRTVEVYVRERSSLEFVSCFEGACVARADPFDDALLDLSVLWLPYAPTAGMP